MDLLDPVDREEVAPDLPHRSGRVADRLEHVDLARVGRVLELELDPVRRVPDRAPVDLEQDAIELARAPTALRPVVELAKLPPVPRAGDEPRRAAADAVVDPGELRQSLVVADEPDRARAPR